MLVKSESLDKSLYSGNTVLLKITKKIIRTYLYMLVQI